MCLKGRKSFFFPPSWDRPSPSSSGIASSSRKRVCCVGGAVVNSALMHPDVTRASQSTH
ncbi:hypothetical protein Plhal304r1_c032g0102111 [Plasmopara halstedii]